MKLGVNILNFGPGGSLSSLAPAIPVQVT